jgi:hypothetical protein
MFHLKFHLTGNTEAVAGQCVAMNEQSKKQFEPLSNKTGISLETECGKLGTVKLPRSATDHHPLSGRAIARGIPWVTGPAAF